MGELGALVHQLVRGRQAPHLGSTRGFTASGDWCRPNVLLRGLRRPARWLVFFGPVFSWFPRPGCGSPGEEALYEC